MNKDIYQSWTFSFEPEEVIAALRDYILKHCADEDKEKIREAEAVPENDLEKNLREKLDLFDFDLMFPIETLPREKIETPEFSK